MILLLNALASLFAGRVLTGWIFSDEEPADRLTLWLLWSLTLFLLTPLLVGWVAGALTAGRLLAGFAVLALAALAAHLAVARRHTAWKYDRIGLGESILKDLGLCIWRANWKARFAWLAVLAWTLGMAAPGWFLPPRTWDAIECYMLQPVNVLPPNDFTLAVPLPGGTEQYRTLGETFPNLKGFWAVQTMLARGSMKGAGLAQVPFLLVALAALWAIGRRLELPGWTTAAGAFFLVSMPEVMLQSTELYTDLQAASALLIVLWALSGLQREAHPRRWIAAAGLAFGQLAAAKASLLVPGGLLGLLAVVLAARRAGRGQRLGAALRMVAAGLLGVTVLAGPWMLRAAVVHKNPIYPISVSAGGKEILPGIFPAGLNSGVLRDQTGLTEAQAYWQAATESGGITHLGYILGGWGPQALIFGLPGLVLLIVLGARKKAHLWRLVLTAVVGVALAAPDLWWPRFGLQLLAFATLGVAAWLAISTRWERVLLLLILVACASWNLYRVAPAILYRPYSPTLTAYPFITGDTTPLLGDHPPDEFTARDFARELAGDDDALRIGYGHHVSYHLPPIRLVPDDMRNSLVALPRIADTAGPGEWLDTLAQSGASFFLFPVDSPEGHLLDAQPHTYGRAYADRPWRSEHPWGPAQYPHEAVWGLLEPIHD